MILVTRIEKKRGNIISVRENLVWGDYFVKPAPNSAACHGRYPESNPQTHDP